MDAAAAAGGRGGGGGRARSLTSTPGAKQSRRSSRADSRDVYYLEGGRVQAITVDNRAEPRRERQRARWTSISTRKRWPSSKRPGPRSATTSTIPNYHGADWNAVRKTYAPLIEGSRNARRDARASCA